MSHPSDFGLLDHDGAGPPTHGDILAAIRSHASKTDEWIADSRQWREQQAEVNADLRAELKANTAETISAREAIAVVQAGMTTARTVKVVTMWLGGIAGGALAIWQFAKFALTGIPPGPDPGP